MRWGFGPRRVWRPRILSRAASTARRQVRIHRPLRAPTVHDALVIPLVVPASDSYDVSAGAGVVTVATTSVTFLESSALRRFGHRIIPPPGTDRGRESPASTMRRAIFGGYVFDHFGHFLLETLCRLWVEQSGEIDADIPVVWISTSRHGIRPWMSDVFQRLGMQRSIVLVDETTGPLAVDELIVPAAGFELREFLHPTQLRRLACVPWRPDAERKIWLSRSGPSGLTTVPGEPVIEERLRNLGWSVVHPESLSIDQQLDTLAGATRIAGVEGSALHALALMKEFGGSVDIVPRRSSPNYSIIADVAGWDQHIHAPTRSTSGLEPSALALAIDRRPPRRR